MAPQILVVGALLRMDKKLPPTETDEIDGSVASARRSFTRWMLDNVEHESLDAFLGNEAIGAAVHTINHCNALIDIYYRPREGAKSLIVFFNAAQSAALGEKLIFPVFSGLNLAKFINSSLAAISDPSLHLDDDLRLAWYLGTTELDLAPACADIVKRLAAASGAENIILFGGSGGGFAALNIGQMIPNSLSIASNPQTDIGRFYKASVDKFAETCFSSADFERIDPALKESRRMYLPEVYSRGFDNYLVYLQNLSDPHLQIHAVPFFEAIDDKEFRSTMVSDRPGIYSVSNRAILCIGDWGRGHVVAPPGALQALLKLCAETELEVSELFKLGHIEQVLKTHILEPQSPT